VARLPGIGARAGVPGRRRAIDYSLSTLGAGGCWTPIVVSM
jgi:hypothetical protein